MKPDKLVEALKAMSPRDASELADAIKALPENRRSLIAFKLTIILIMAVGDETLKTEVKAKIDEIRAKTAFHQQRDTDTVRHL